MMRAQRLAWLWMGLVLVAILSLGQSGSAQTVVTQVGDGGSGPVVTVKKVTDFPAGAKIGQTVSANLSASSTAPTPPPYCTVNDPSTWGWSWAVVSVMPSEGASVTLTPDPTDPTKAKVDATFTQTGSYTVIVSATVQIGSSCGQNWTATGQLGMSPSDGPLTTTVIAVSINTPNGIHVGAVHDPNTLPLQAIPDPSWLSGETFAWSVIAGPGNGLFLSPSDQNPQFKGLTEGSTTVQVDMSYGGATATATKDLWVIRIDDLTDSVPDQFMDQVFLTSGYYTIPFSDGGGRLLAVLVGPPDISPAYAWEEDFYGRVDQPSGDTTLTFLSDGPYLVKIVRENSWQYIQVIVDGGEGNAEPDEVGWSSWGGGGEPGVGGGLQGRGPTPDRPDIARLAVATTVLMTDGALGADAKLLRLIESALRQPPGGVAAYDLIMISNSGNDNGFLAANRLGLWHVNIGSVQDAINWINFAYQFINWAEGNQVPRRISVLVVGHGAPGFIEMGTGQGAAVAGKGLFSGEIGNAASWTRAFANTCNGQVYLCTLFGCNVGRGAAGNTLCQGLATRGNMQTRAYDRTVFATFKWNPRAGRWQYNWWVARGFQLRVWAP